MVGSACFALVNVNTSHKVGLYIFRQRLNDVYALIVFAFGVDDVDGFVLAYQHALVAYLSAHLAIEGSGVEHQLEEGVLLLCYLAVAQDVALIFGVVVSYKLLFALAQHHPVAILYSGGVAGALFLLLHLGVKLFLVDGVTVLAADKFGEVEGEAVGVEHAEGLCTIEHGLSVCFQLVHSAVEQVDAFLKGAQERVFLFFHYAANELLLCRQLGVGSAHFLYKDGQQLIQEGLFLAEEGVGVAHGTTQDATNDVSCLGVAGQLAIGY